MKKIKNKEDLYAEKLRLQLELSKAESVLKEDMDWLNEELKPLHATGKVIKNIFYTKGGLVNEGLRFGIDSILKNTVLSKAGWVTKLVVPFIVKGVSSGLMQDKKHEIFSFLRTVIQKARKSNAKDNLHYDKSTVEDVDY